MKKVIEKIDSLAIAKSIKKQFEYVPIEDNVFYQIAASVLRNTMKGNSIRTIEEFKTKYKENLKIAFKNYADEKIKSDSVVNVVDYFAYKLMSPCSGLERNLRELNKLEKFIEENNIKLTLNDCIQLLNKNKKLKGHIKSIASTDITTIHSELFQLFITAYFSDEFESIEENENNNLQHVNIYLEYIKEIRNKKILSKEEFNNLFIKFKNGDQNARKILLESNLKLVINVAKYYKDNGLDFMDLIGEGNYALIKALDGFDYQKGYHFSSYAITCIARRIVRSIYKYGRNITLPIAIAEEVRNFKNTRRTLIGELQRVPTLEEVANRLNISIDEAKELELLQYDTVSLDEPIKEDSNTLLMEMIKDDSDFVEEIIMENEKRAKVLELINNSKLSERDKIILYYRYGLNNENELTYEEIRQYFGLSRARIGQIEIAALGKIRRSNKVRNLAIFMDDPDKALAVLENFQKTKKKTKKI